MLHDKSKVCTALLQVPWQQEKTHPEAAAIRLLSVILLNEVMTSLLITAMFSFQIPEDNDWRLNNGSRSDVITL